MKKNDASSFDKLLIRQLSQSGLTDNELPISLIEWKKFLQHVNQVYMQSTQDRYLLERSLNLVSKEMSELNDKIENAQHIAHMGYWFYDITNRKTQWSKEIYDMFGYKYNDSMPSYEEMMKNYIHEDDWLNLQNLIQKSLENGEEYETEIRILNKETKNFRWFYIKGKPLLSSKNNDDFHTLAGIIIDITERKEDELKISQLNQQLIAAAKRARTAEMSIASSLHNIGNVLNSVNISSGLLSESLHLSTVNKLESVVSMLKDNVHNMAEYLAQDPKGKLLPNFIEAAVASIKSDYDILMREINNIIINTNHMKEIIRKQKELADPSSSSEDSFTISNLLDDAIHLSLGPKNKIQINKKINLDDQIKIFNDKHKILQILVNLIRNSSDSLLAVNSNNKQIEIIATSISDKVIAISVKDNGAGIQEDNIKKIFNFGFTTKPSGHGFGLHNSALIAKELGGLLKVESDGHNKGATFTLQFPISLPSEDE